MVRGGEGLGTRLDMGITEGAAITTAFDPMLAKLIVHGKDREEARSRALAALKEFVLLGCETNVAFLRRLIAHAAFRDGDVHTGFIDAHPEIAAEAADPATLHRMLAIVALSVRPVRDAADATPQPHGAMGGWRN
jgi:acetyl/propionyl-CoA carboxylase alpha subunit